MVSSAHPDDGKDTPRPWTDTARTAPERVALLLDAMTLEEKIAQLGSVWPDRADKDADVAPVPGGDSRDDHWELALTRGIGEITRVFGSRPVDPAAGVQRLARLQAELVAEFRLRIPAISHEECLTGLTAQGATMFPSPLALAAGFDPEPIERMATAIGTLMASLGIHQGLSPLLDVVRDPRWGRTEETFGEDPYLVGCCGTAYVRGLQSGGIIATPKHFVGYSGSRGGRNHAPVSVGRRELADVFLAPFEMAVRLGDAGAIMNSYADVDGLAAAADAELLTGVLRDQWGFTGIVSSDYSSVSHLVTTQRIAADAGEAGALALQAGVDVELPETVCYGRALTERVRDGRVAEATVDRAVARVLHAKLRLGLLDGDDGHDGLDGGTASASPQLDPPAHRALARELAERSVVLLANERGLLPLDGRPGTVAVVGPGANDPLGLLGCYTLPNFLRGRTDDASEVGLGGVRVDSLREALQTELPDAVITHAAGGGARASTEAEIAEAVAVARDADVVVLGVGDLPGLFGHGTSGEGNDAVDLAFPGDQAALADAVLATGTPVVLVVVSGRPYALGPYVERAAAIVQAFLPGEEGGGAIAGVLSGRVNPGGRLPVQVPERVGGQPFGYLAAPLGGTSFTVSSADPRAAFPFGHGLSYSRFEYSDLRLDSAEIACDGAVEITCAVTNVSERDGTEVVQLYLADPIAEVARPEIALVGFARVALAAGERAEVAFTLHAERTAYTGRRGRRVVDPGEIRLAVGASCADLRLRASVRLTGEQRVLDGERVMVTPVEVRRSRR